MLFVRTTALLSKITRLTPLFIFCVVTGCANQQVANTAQIQEKVAHSAEKRALTQAEALTSAEQALNIAKDEQLDFYAPLHLSQARAAYSLAQSLATSPDSERPNGVIEEALAAKTFITEGLATKKDVSLYLKEAIAHKRMLQKLEVPERFSEEYKEVLSNFGKLIRLIEQGEADEALNQQKPLRMRMTELEIQALLQIHLDEAARVMTEVESLNGERYAPFSYYNAKHKLESSQQYTRSHFRDRKGVEKNGIVSLKLAKQALEMTIESKRIMDMDSTKSEQYVLAQQKKYHNLLALLNKKDIQPGSLEQDYLKLETALKQSLESNQALSEKVSRLENELKRYTETELTGYSDTASSDVQIIEVMNKKELGNEPSMQDDEQGFDTIEFVK